VLRALNALHPEPLAPNALLALAATLGSDVPFLVSDVPLALAWGRGERMLALPALPERDIALVLPPFGVETREAYGWLARSREAASASTRDTPPDGASQSRHGGGVHGAGPVLHPFSAVTSWEGVAAISENDFEPVVFAERPELGSIHERLAELPAVAVARMSGSGSTLFALFHDPAEVRVVAQATGCRVIAARTLSSVVPHLRVD
jgi:4-diphosphocytidyl-2-C-methyl-D-erythritol kinase